MRQGPPDDSGFGISKDAVNALTGLLRNSAPVKAINNYMNPTPTPSPSPQPTPQPETMAPHTGEMPIEDLINMYLGAPQPTVAPQIAPQVQPQQIPRR